jgi:hypothetical protein
VSITSSRCRGVGTCSGDLMCLAAGSSSSYRTGDALHSSLIRIKWKQERRLSRVGVVPGSRTCACSGSRTQGPLHVVLRIRLQHVPIKQVLYRLYLAEKLKEPFRKGSRRPDAALLAAREAAQLDAAEVRVPMDCLCVIATLSCCKYLNKGCMLVA